MTDTPVAPQTFPPPSMPDQIKAFIGDLARPFAIISVFSAASISIVKIAWTLSERSTSWEGAAFFVGALTALALGCYGAKAWENERAAKHTADVDVAKASSTGTTS